MTRMKGEMKVSFGVCQFGHPVGHTNENGDKAVELREKS